MLEIKDLHANINGKKFFKEITLPVIPGKVNS